jgi:hypothetical protein
MVAGVASRLRDMKSMVAAGPMPPMMPTVLSLFPVVMDQLVIIANFEEAVNDEM